MRKVLIFLLLPIALSAQEFNYIGSGEPAEGSGFNINVVNGVTQYYELLIVAVDSGASPVIPGWLYPLPTEAHDFFSVTSFEKADYQGILLGKNATQAFIMPHKYTGDDGGCEHVHSMENVIAVLQEADAIYNFGYYDFDNNGVVEVHFISIGFPQGGAGMSCFGDIYTNDKNANGTTVRLRVGKQTRAGIPSTFSKVLVHENGHSLFGFPDMEHVGLSANPHYSLGDFDVMATGGFNGTPSPYNPWFRHIKGWFNPTVITGNLNGALLEDFHNSHKCYLYQPSKPSNSYNLPKFYITYHNNNINRNYYYSGWPIKDPDKGGVLIWRVSDPQNSIKPTGYSSNYIDWRKAPIDIEAAHGKYLWQEVNQQLVNTNVANALTGRDSLEIRRVSG